MRMDFRDSIDKLDTAAVPSASLDFSNQVIQSPSNIHNSIDITSDYPYGFACNPELIRKTRGV
jgi:hypothetical protein